MDILKRGKKKLEITEDFNGAERTPPDVMFSKTTGDIQTPALRQRTEQEQKEEEQPRRRTTLSHRKDQANRIIKFNRDLRLLFFFFLLTIIFTYLILRIKIGLSAEEIKDMAVNFLGLMVVIIAGGYNILAQLKTSPGMIKREFISAEVERKKKEEDKKNKGKIDKWGRTIPGG